ncbi:hypothetical protein AAEX28_07215 [Lentisphaerota bacterium WC36G]|nr:hypothetical protein LJT99_10080 [Lentisphaerae bacterium WC36]UDQ99307.1 hypothetical protein LJT99_07155 [Lentisphaerae bacterium WC36]
MIDFNLAIGKTFKIDEKTFKVVEDLNCSRCLFREDAKCFMLADELPFCDPGFRDDSKNVSFSEVVK